MLIRFGHAETRKKDKDLTHGDKDIHCTRDINLHVTISALNSPSSSRYIPTWTISRWFKTRTNSKLINCLSGPLNNVIAHLHTNTVCDAHDASIVIGLSVVSWLLHLLQVIWPTYTVKIRNQVSSSLVEPSPIPRYFSLCSQLASAVWPGHGAKNTRTSKLKTNKG